MKKINLDTEKYSSGFTTPPNYFDNFSSSVLGRLHHEDKPVIKLRSSKWEWLLVAAAILIVALMLPFLNRVVSLQPSTSENGIENYLVRSTSSDELIRLMESEDLQYLTFDNGIDDHTIEEILSTNKNLEILMY